MREKESASPARRPEIIPPGGHPLAAWRQEMDSLFDRFFAPIGRGSGFNPALDLTENDKEVRLRAELPGVEEKDVDIRLDGDVLTIRGEKREERTEEGEQRRLIERSYGSFERSLRLPFVPEDDGVTADFKNGVLTVTARKPASFSGSAKQIPISH
jgi:HSP20 family protein